MIGNLGRERGEPLLSVVAMLISAAALLQFRPHTDSGFQFMPLPPWTYGGWLLAGISLLSWMAIGSLANRRRAGRRSSARLPAGL